jgi:hypothetical protein
MQLENIKTNAMKFHKYLLLELLIIFVHVIILMKKKLNFLRKYEIIVYFIS